MSTPAWVVLAASCVVAVGSCFRGAQENIERSASVADLALTSTREVDLQERTYALHFRGGTAQTERSGRTTNLVVPPLTIDIEGPTGAPKPEKTIAIDSETTSVAGDYIRQIGVVDIHQAGRYTVRVASPSTRGGTVGLGEMPTPAANLFVRSFGILLAGGLFAAGIGKWRARGAPADVKPST